ncbi:MAG: class II fructose-bisphosphate aldolase [Alphaproteobacteria bacterium]|jgi:fructose/tagatose bisphosphate aldolase|nr:class II fructose-bisphosphate aldolase [Alphaproteobacteria bacterium]
MSANIFYNLQQVECVLAAAVEDDQPVTLLTAPGAAAYGGPEFYLAMVAAARAQYPTADVTAILDCGEDGALAQAALNLGWRHLVLRGGATVREKLRQIAKHHGGVVLAKPPSAMDPGPDE